MKKVRAFISVGWHVLEKLHTAIWLFGVFGVTAGSLATFFLSLSEQRNLPVLLLIQTLVWGLITVTAVALIGYRVKRNDAQPAQIAPQVGTGGAGGGGTIVGNGGTIIGGRGGDGGVGGIGGAGGGGHIQGDDGLIVGGDGGNAGTADGRGGRRTQSPMERMGQPTQYWHFGNGGAGGNHPEYNRRIGLLASIRREYMESFPGEVQFIEAGVDLVPINWVNKRLEELQEGWRVTLGPNGYLLPNIM